MFSLFLRDPFFPDYWKDEWPLKIKKKIKPTILLSLNDAIYKAWPEFIVPFKLDNMRKRYAVKKNKVPSAGVTTLKIRCR